MLDDEEEAMAEALASLPPFTEQEYLTSCQDQENELAELESLVWAKKSPKSLNSEQVWTKQQQQKAIKQIILDR